MRAREQVTTVERADAGVLPQLQRPRDARVGEELPARGRSRRGRAGHVAVREGWQGYVHHGLHVAHECLAGVRDLSHVLRQQAGVRVTLRFSKPYIPLYYHPSKSPPYCKSLTALEFTVSSHGAEAGRGRRHRGGVRRVH